MKILYLAEWDAFSASGVVRKIRAQFHTWRSFGVDARLVVVSPEGKSGSAPLLSGDGISVVTHRKGRFGVGKLFKALALRRVKKIVDDYDPDVIYYRQSSWTPGILNVLKSAPCVVAEINSNDVFEIGQYGWAKARFHLLTRKRLLALVKGFVCVGHDIGEYYKQYGKPVSVVPNGFDTSSVTPRSIPQDDRVNLVFVGSPGQRWHGVDKILDLAKKMPEFFFHIIGDDFPVDCPNVRCYGHVDWDRLDKLYRGMDVGIASLALHRINIDEISPLKTREYLAYGLPIITAYFDPDLEGCEFVLRLPNCETGVTDSVEDIRRFALHWKGRSVDMNDVRSRIDSSVKERSRVQFLQQVFDANAGHGQVR